MKIKNISAIIFAALSLTMSAQLQPPVQYKLIATTENAMYGIYEQLLDSAIALKSPLISYYFGSIENSDTLMKIEQYCYWYRGFPEQYICEKERYDVSISDLMPVEFYERFLGFLIKLGKNDNIFNKYYSFYPLYRIKDILINRYESGKLSKAEGLKVLKLIEDATLRLILDANNFQFLYGDNKYMTENIRQALVNVIEHPFYPENYLNFYLKEVVDTTVLDTTGIPIDIQKAYKKWKGLYTSGNLDYDLRLAKFYNYKKMGKELGLSPGQAYLEEKKKEFPEKGYVDINLIADYAFKSQDSLIIAHLKEFKKNHPDYPLRHF